MLRPKSPLRQLLSYRRLRWALSYLVIGPVPPLARHLNFHPRGAYPAEVAETVVEDVEKDVPSSFSADQLAMIARLCRFADAGAADSDATGVARFVLKTHLVRDVEILGHTGAVAVPRARAVIWPAPSPPSWNVTKPRRLAPSEGPAGRTVSLSGTDNYFHFLMNDIVPLLDYLERLHPAGLRLNVVVPRTPPAFTFATLDALGAAFPDISVIRLAAGRKMIVDELLTLERRTANREWYSWDGGLAERLKGHLMGHFGLKSESGPGRPLFVRRGPARIRRLLNEDKLARIAESRGAAVFTPKAENFADQLRLFDAAPVVLSAHGAALANVMWCRPGSQVLELFPENFVKSTYMWLSDRMAADHHVMRGSPGDSFLAFSVDPDDFARRLDALMEAWANAGAGADP